MQNNYVFLNNSLISFHSLIDQSIFLTAYPAELCSGAEGYRIWHLVISGVHLGQVVGQSQAQSRDNHTANLEKQYILKIQKVLMLDYITITHVNISYQTSVYLM